VKEDKSAILQWVQEKGPNAPYQGKNPLMRALELGDKGLVLELLRLGAQVERSHFVELVHLGNPLGWSASLLCPEGATELPRLLLVIAVGGDRKTLKELAKSADERKLLEENKWAWKIGRFSEAVKDGDEERVHVLAQLSQAVPWVDVWFDRLDHSKLSAYLKKGGNPDAVLIHSGRTLLEEAVRYRDLKAASLLLEAGANPDHQGPKGMPPIFYLNPAYGPADKTREYLLALLVFYGANLGVKNAYGNTLEDLLEWWIKKHKTSLSPKTFYNEFSFLGKVRNPEALIRQKLHEGVFPLHPEANV